MFSRVTNFARWTWRAGISRPPIKASWSSWSRLSGISGTTLEPLTTSIAGRARKSLAT